MPLKLLWIIQAAPLVAFLLIQLLPKSMRKTAPVIGVLGSGAAALASLRLFWMFRSGENLPLELSREWLKVTDTSSFFVGFLVDPLNLLMITLVTSISFFVQVFSVYYMNEDASRHRYFGFLSFFSFSMTGLVLSNNLLQTFLFWELVGLTSYLLIGFWYEKPSAATAARKAFVINRLGDLGFYLGVILLFILFGSLSFADLNRQALEAQLSPKLLTLLGVLVFMGVMGKSAQFPFHVWLPDAMEGPTPVSALIHSATMVAAGVFLLCRSFELFSASQTTLLVVLATGAMTAFVGASLATVQRDIKKIMAYSTVSQLGLMVMAVGAGSSVSAMFHLSTHAYFKSLLFLTAGAFIHHYHTNDIWEIGRKGGKHDRLAVFFLLVGLLSLSGVPPFAGFFSKDMILESIYHHSLFFYAVAVFVSFLTVYYSTRLFLVITLSKEKGDAGATHDGHAHTPWLLEVCRALPLIFLFALSAFVGVLGTPWTGHGEPMSRELLITTAALILGGLTLGILQFRNPEAAEEKLKNRKDLVHILLERKFFIDDVYAYLTKQVGLGIAAVLDWFDRNIINGLMVNQTAFSIMRLGRVMSRLQNGLLQDYLFVALGTGIIVLFYLVNRAVL